jgi:hypothetical protein
LAGGPKKLGLVCLCFLADGRRKKNGREGMVDRHVWRRDMATVEERIESTFELGRRVENWQQEVARLREQRRTAAAGGGNGGQTAAVAEKNRATPEEEEKGDFPRTGL